MKQSPAKAPTIVGRDRTVVAERTIEFLRHLHPQKTADHVAADTGIAAGTVARWLDRGSAPSAWALLRLLGIYGPEFACAVMDEPPGWVDRAAREERQDRLERRAADIQRQIDDLREGRL